MNPLLKLLTQGNLWVAAFLLDIYLFQVTVGQAKLAPTRKFVFYFSVGLNLAPTKYISCWARTVWLGTDFYKAKFSFVLYQVYVYLLQYFRTGLAHIRYVNFGQNRIPLWDGWGWGIDCRGTSLALILVGFWTSWKELSWVAVQYSRWMKLDIYITSREETHRTVWKSQSETLQYPVKANSWCLITMRLNSLKANKISKRILSSAGEKCL